MALTLRVTSFQSQALGSESTRVFDTQGGTIGRGPDNDWVLPDPEKFVSTHHAQIACRNGIFYLCDVSTNGTFVNGSPQPIGSGSEQQLVEGDRVQIGDYEVGVSLAGTDQAVVTGPPGFNMGPGGAFATNPSGPTGPGESGGFGGQEFGQPGSVDPMKMFEGQPPPAGPSMDPGVDSNHGSALQDFYQPPAIQQAPPMSGDQAASIAAMLQTAGLDPAAARQAAASPALVSALGGILNVAVHGMVDVLKARSEIKSQFRVPLTMMRPVENNPLKFSATPAQALHNLLVEQNQAYLGPVEAFTEGFQDIKAHQMAMMAGMRAAFDSMIKRFDPEELSGRFEKRLKHGSLIGKLGKGRYWDMYRDLYEEWTKDADVNFQSLFGDEFARAYEDQMRQLTSVKR